MFYKSKEKRGRLQVSLRLPEFMIEHVNKNSKYLGMTKNDYYIFMIYDYLLKNGFYSELNQDNGGSQC